MKFLNQNNSLIYILKGVIISVLFTIISLTIFSVLLTYTELSEDTIKPVIIVLTGISILLGSSLQTRKAKKNGLQIGGFIGGGYILILYVFSSIINHDIKLNIISAIMIVIRNNFRYYGRNIGSQYQIIEVLTLNI